MLNKHVFFLLIHVFVFVHSQTINIKGKQLVIGMEKSEALDIMHEFLEHADYDSLSDNFWLKAKMKLLEPWAFKKRS